MTNKLNIFRKPFLLLLLLAFGAHSLKAETSFRKFFVNLYGHILQINYNADFYSTREQLLNEVSINNLLNALWNDKQTDSLIKQLDKQAAQFNMDDMAYLLMLTKTTETVFKHEDAAFKTIYKYGVLKQKGFDVLLGYGDKNVTVYGATDFDVQNALFIQKGNTKYYDLSFNKKAQVSIENEFIPSHKTNSNNAFHLNTISPPLFNAKQTRKHFPYEYDGYVYFLYSDINQSLVDYYAELPDININSVYLNYGLSAQAQKTLVKGLRDATEGMSKTNAVDFILKFTQHAFEYKKDAVEKFAFPEEVLSNHFADCEDKSILFAYLTKEVLGINSIALFYKNEEHINVAIENWKKDDISTKGTFNYNQHRYIVCEPSGDGFNPGESINNISYADVIAW